MSKPVPQCDGGGGGIFERWLGHGVRGALVNGVRVQ